MELKSKIDKFFNGTLTYDEEQELYLYLCSNDVPAEMQRDKETIIALCTDANDYTLPIGASERLIAMLDALGDASPVATTIAKQHVKPASNNKRVAVYICGFAAIAAVVVFLFMLCLPQTQTIADEELGVAYEQEPPDTSTIKTFVLSEPETITLTESEIELLRKDSTGVMNVEMH